MGTLEQKAVDILDKLENLATQYTPEVIDAATSAVTVTALGNILSGIVGIGAAIFALWVTKNFAKYCRRKRQEEGWMSDWEIGWALGLGVGGITSGLIALISVWSLFDVWNWVALFNPKLALAHRVLGL